MNFFKTYSIQIFIVLSIIGFGAFIGIRSKYPLVSQEYHQVKKVILQNYGNTVIEDEDGHQLALNGNFKVGDQFVIECNVSPSKTRQSCQVIKK